ncbi:MAG: 50S ribosomal protein L4 [Cytophagaceae bacterium]|nr:50S ribosomal protein L4 [Cytophagaceae bacterium]MBK9932663.1 50S ribosomal protein L4 [Cytophagaceae bacterium]MBL0303645.1 50S ribosomal protein L4 [Cytophagaceae bacterium]MBL0326475.1 50S ribosomal protein L4 [Cytophagaceae bacterium]
MKIKVLNKEGKETGKSVELSDEVFGIEPNQHVVWLDVKHYLANQRQGTHKSKERAEVSRSTKKLLRQKGSGGARHGSAKAPTYVGGGRVFGPRPRDYDFKLNKKVKVLARKSVLSARLAENNLIVVEDFGLDTPKTKAYISFLNALNLAGKKTLFVVNGGENNLYLSSRNIPKTKVLDKDSVNTYELINTDVILLAESTVSHLESILKD